MLLQWGTGSLGIVLCLSYSVTPAWSLYMCLHIHAVMSIPGHMTRTCWSQKEQRTALCKSCFGFFNDDCRTEIKLRCKSSLRDLRTFCLLGKRKRELSTIVFFKMRVLYLMRFYTNYWNHGLRSFNKCQWCIWKWDSVSTGILSVSRDILGCLAFDCDRSFPWFSGNTVDLITCLGSLSEGWK